MTRYINNQNGQENVVANNFTKNPYYFILHDVAWKSNDVPFTSHRRFHVFCILLRYICNRVKNSCYFIMQT